MLGPRKDFLSWDEYFMMMAVMTAQRSKDPHKQVGAVIVSPDNVPMGAGYNGFPRGIDSDEFPWDKEGDFINTKYPYVQHSERNAILNSTYSLKGCKLYCTRDICHECAKDIIQKQISEVIYMEHKPADQDCVIARLMFKKAGIKVRQFCITPERIEEIFASLTKMLQNVVKQ